MTDSDLAPVPFVPSSRARVRLDAVRRSLAAAFPLTVAMVVLIAALSLGITTIHHG